MLSDGVNLERLLDRLFGNGEGSNPEDIMVLKRRIRPPEILSVCCTYSYTGYGE